MGLILRLGGVYETRGDSYRAFSSGVPDDVLQEMGVDVGNTLYLLEEYVGTTRCLVLSKSPRIPDRVDELVGHWESFGKVTAEINAKDE